MPYELLSDSGSESEVERPVSIGKKDNSIQVSSKEEPFEVQMINQRIAQTITKGFPSRIYVRGEVTGLTKRGHYYFNLQDASGGSLIRTIIWKSCLTNVVPFQNGDKVIVESKISHYSKQGNYNLQVYSLTKQLDQEGELKQRIQLIRKKAERKGYFSSTKKDIPKYPSTIGIVTSLHGDAIQDVITYLRSDSLIKRVIVFDAKVQGQHCVKSLVDCITRCNQNPEVECLLITRGGGSQQDLMSFNELAVLRGIYQCKIPVLTGIGHTLDQSLADLAADHEAITPTALARLVSGDSKKETTQRLSKYRDVLTTIYQKYLQGVKYELQQRHSKLQERNVQLDVKTYLLQLRVFLNSLLVNFQKQVSVYQGELATRRMKLNSKITASLNYLGNLRKDLQQSVKQSICTQRQHLRKYTQRLNSLRTDPFSNEISVITDLVGQPLQFESLHTRGKIPVKIVIQGKVYEADILFNNH